ncbi:MAG TPA: DNA oxidative demethylase AlkB [Ideonella sp.]|nr:DNA oxidative demethylase AlkB [Ideonella sp.]
MTPDLFEIADEESRTPACEPLAPGAVVLRAGALRDAPALLADIGQVLEAAPLRHLITPGGFRMSVGMSNCGRFGWVSDPSGYRYDPLDPGTGRPWPALPASFRRLAADAAAQAGFEHFEPDACLINRYEPGARLSLHQDRDERDLRQPIVSVSLGLPAVFQFGGLKRGDPITRVPLQHGDVVVWGGPSRLRYHGVLAVKAGHHRLTGACRINLTFRCAM